MRRVVLAACVGLFQLRTGEPAVDQRPSMLQHFLNSFNATADIVRSLARFDLDVDGDGTPEVFLGLPGNQYGQDWFGYRIRTDGTCDPLGALRFHFQAFYYDASQRRLWAYVRVTANSGGFVQYHLTASGFVEDEHPGRRSVSEDKARATAWAKGGRPKLGWAELAAVASGKGVWRSLDSGEALQLDPHVTSLPVR